MNKNKRVVSAISKCVLISPTKINLVATKIRGKSYEEALLIFRNINQKAGKIVLQTLLSAIANATHNNGISKSDLVVVEAFANQGTILKRMQPRARGKAYEIQRKMSHLTIRIAERNYE